ncbi:MAG: sulfurtransferase TusA family protein [Gammaproteobacteria bacterium]|nr:sulfurtransferase TusA family protein [Gammaproteobacteria bacterium]
MIEFQHELDVRSVLCPGPVMETKKALMAMPVGDVLHVIATDPSSVGDIAILLSALTCEMLETQQNNDEYHFFIRKK